MQFKQNKLFRENASKFFKEIGTEEPIITTVSATETQTESIKQFWFNI